MEEDGQRPSSSRLGVKGLLARFTSRSSPDTAETQEKRNPVVTGATRSVGDTANKWASMDYSIPDEELQALRTPVDRKEDFTDVQGEWGRHVEDEGAAPRIPTPAAVENAQDGLNDTSGDATLEESLDEITAEPEQSAMLETSGSIPSTSVTMSDATELQVGSQHIHDSGIIDHSTTDQERSVNVVGEVSYATDRTMTDSGMLSGTTTDFEDHPSERAIANDQLDMSRDEGEAKGTDADADDEEELQDDEEELQDDEEELQDDEEELQDDEEELQDDDVEDDDVDLLEEDDDEDAELPDDEADVDIEEDDGDEDELGDYDDEGEEDAAVEENEEEAFVDASGDVDLTASSDPSLPAPASTSAPLSTSAGLSSILVDYEGREVLPDHGELDYRSAVSLKHVSLENIHANDDRVVPAWASVKLKPATPVDHEIASASTDYLETISTSKADFDSVADGNAGEVEAKPDVVNEEAERALLDEGVAVEEDGDNSESQGNITNVVEAPMEDSSLEQVQQDASGLVVESVPPDGPELNGESAQEQEKQASVPVVERRRSRPFSGLLARFSGRLSRRPSASPTQSARDDEPKQTNLDMTASSPATLVVSTDVEEPRDVPDPDVNMAPIPEDLIVEGHTIETLNDTHEEMIESRDGVPATGEVMVEAKHVEAEFEEVDEVAIVGEMNATMDPIRRTPTGEAQIIGMDDITVAKNYKRVEAETITIPGLNRPKKHAVGKDGFSAYILGNSARITLKGGNHKLFTTTVKGHRSSIVDCSWCPKSSKEGQLHALATSSDDGITLLTFLWVEMKDGEPSGLRLLKSHPILLPTALGSGVYYSKARLTGSPSNGKIALVASQGHRLRIVNFSAEELFNPDIEQKDEAMLQVPLAGASSMPAVETTSPLLATVAVSEDRTFNDQMVGMTADARGPDAPMTSDEIIAPNVHSEFPLTGDPLEDVPTQQISATENYPQGPMDIASSMSVDKEQQMHQASMDSPGNGLITYEHVGLEEQVGGYSSSRLVPTGEPEGVYEDDTAEGYEQGSANVTEERSLDFEDRTIIASHVMEPSGLLTSSGEVVGGDAPSGAVDELDPVMDGPGELPEPGPSSFVIGSSPYVLEAPGDSETAMQGSISMGGMEPMMMQPGSMPDRDVGSLPGSLPGSGRLRVSGPLSAPGRSEPEDTGQVAVMGSGTVTPGTPAPAPELPSMPESGADTPLSGMMTPDSTYPAAGPLPPMSGADTPGSYDYSSDVYSGTSTPGGDIPHAPLLPDMPRSGADTPTYSDHSGSGAATPKLPAAAPAWPEMGGSSLPGSGDLTPWLNSGASTPREYGAPPSLPSMSNLGYDPYAAPPPLPTIDSSFEGRGGGDKTPGSVHSSTSGIMTPGPPPSLPSMGETTPVMGRSLASSTHTTPLRQAGYPDMPLPGEGSSGMSSAIDTPVLQTPPRLPATPPAFETPHRFSSADSVSLPSPPKPPVLHQMSDIPPPPPPPAAPSMPRMPE